MNPVAESAAALGGRPEPLVSADLLVAQVAGVRPGRLKLRQHLAMGTGRLLALLFADLLVIGMGRWLFALTHAGGLGRGAQGLVTDLFPPGAISGTQLALAIVVAFFFLGCYRDGDRWRDPVRILTATAVGTAMAFYSDLWHGEALAVGGRGVLVWLGLGPTLISARAAAAAGARRVAAAGMRHYVVEVKGEEVGGESLDLGPSFRWITSVDHEQLPMDLASVGRVIPSRIDTIVVRGYLPRDRFHVLADYALTRGCRLLCAPYPAQLPGVEKTRVWMEGHPLVEITAPSLRASHVVLKRALDLLVATVLLVLLSPLFAALALWIKLDSEGPVLFRQSRPGVRGRPFHMWKFRSMRADAEAVLGQDAELYERFLGNGCKLPDGEDPRVTKVGSFMRRTSLDELPQLLNVIRGDMSLVGPRPLVGPELANYGEGVFTLLSVRPGMTGRWQVSGRSTIEFPERAEMDLEYVRSWSFLGDIWILLLTPAAVLVRRGAH